MRKEQKLDVAFFDDPWLMDHKDWFDASDFTSQALPNRFEATPNHRFVRLRNVDLPDNRLPCYRPSFLKQQRQQNVMIEV